jgi:sugar phosphate isomerase/epimerase
MTDRRGFVLSTLAAAAGAAAMIPRACRAIEPIVRTAGSHFKFSLAAYSYRDLLQGKSKKLTIEDFIEDCAIFNLDGTELTSYYLSQDGPPQYFRDLKAFAFRRGLDVSGTAIRNDFCFPPGERRDKEIAGVKRWIDYADMMDAPVIRIFSGDVQPGQSKEEAIQLSIDAIQECCEHAGKYGVFLALENHGGLTAEADDMLAVVRGVQSPWFGVNMDTGNFRTADPYGDLTKIAPYSLNVQVKVVVRPAGQPGGNGGRRGRGGSTDEPTDFNRLAQILRDAGYRGYVVLEFEEAGDPREECRRYIGVMREAFV